MKSLSPVISLSLSLLITLSIWPRLALSLPPQRLTTAEISQQLQTTPEWHLKNGQIERVFQFTNFTEAIAFVNRLVKPSESLGHHPDIIIKYNQVTISLTTHDMGGLSQLDFDLARQISRLAKP